MSTNLQSPLFINRQYAGTYKPIAMDVREFGAKGDGVMKDTAAIQAAIDAASSAGGGRVLLVGGTFLTGAIKRSRDNERSRPRRSALTMRL